MGEIEFIQDQNTELSIENNQLTKDYYNSVCVIEELKEWLEGISASDLPEIHSATVLSKISELKAI